MNPAQVVISKLGGAQEAARLAGVDVSQVYRWTYPPERGGTGGRIPSKRQHRLLEAARDGGIELSPADFFELRPVGAAPP